MATRGILKNLSTVDATAFVVVTVLTLLARIIQASFGLIAELGERLADAGEAARADITDRVPPGGAYVVTAVRTCDVPAWGAR